MLLRFKQRRQRSRHRALSGLRVKKHPPAGDCAVVKGAAQTTYLASSQAEAVQAFRACRAQWQASYPAVVKRLGRDLPELLSFFSLP